MLLLLRIPHVLCSTNAGVMISVLVDMLLRVHATQPLGSTQAFFREQLPRLILALQEVSRYDVSEFRRRLKRMATILMLSPELERDERARWKTSEQGERLGRLAFLDAISRPEASKARRELVHSALLPRIVIPPLNAAWGKPNALNSELLDKVHAAKQALNLIGGVYRLEESQRPLDDEDKRAVIEHLLPMLCRCARHRQSRTAPPQP